MLFKRLILYICIIQVAKLHQFRTYTTTTTSPGMVPLYPGGPYPSPFEDILTPEEYHRLRAR
jgi:hypothetical protein